MLLLECVERTRRAARFGVICLHWLIMFFWSELTR